MKKLEMNEMEMIEGGTMACAAGGAGLVIGLATLNPFIAVFSIIVMVENC